AGSDRDVAHEYPGAGYLVHHQHGRRRPETEAPSSGSDGHHQARRKGFHGSGGRHPRASRGKLESVASRQAGLQAAAREVVITNPDKIFFPKAGYTKLDLANYYGAVAAGAL